MVLLVIGMLLIAIVILVAYNLHIQKKIEAFNNINQKIGNLSVLQDSPFTDRGSVVEIFTDLSVWAGIRKVIESINMNAAA